MPRMMWVALVAFVVLFLGAVVHKIRRNQSNGQTLQASYASRAIENYNAGVRRHSGHLAIRARRAQRAIVPLDATPPAPLSWLREWITMSAARRRAAHA